MDSKIIKFTCLCLSVFLVSFLWGCSDPRDEVLPTDDLTLVNKEVLLDYHPLEYLTPEVRSAPRLSQTNHSHGWQQADCLKCHRTPLKETTSTVCTNCHGKNGVKPDTCKNCHKVQSEFGDPAKRELAKRFWLVMWVQFT